MSADLRASGARRGQGWAHGLRQLRAGVVPIVGGAQVEQPQRRTEVLVIQDEDGAVVLDSELDRVGALLHA